MEKQWSELTREEKREKRLEDCISPPDVKFRNAEAEKLYKERFTRQLNAMMCREPDRVPVALPTGNYPAYYAGWNLKKVMYDYRALRESWTKFIDDFGNYMDSVMGPGFVWSGRMLEILNYKPYRWPGHGLPDDLTTYQFVEDTYIQADEYDALHKGDDTFMSRRQFEKFYWPSLKKVMDALIDEGIMVWLFAEGQYNQRLDYIGDFPKGWVTWMFDQTDMANAKKMIGDTCCISGNVPSSLMITGTPKDVKECCRKLIETCAPGGGYILNGGCSSTETKNPDNFRVFMEAAMEYGIYK